MVVEPRKGSCEKPTNSVCELEAPLMTGTGCKISDHDESEKKILPRYRAFHKLVIGAINRPFPVDK